MSLAEAATYLGVSKATLRNWDKAGKLLAVRHPINGYRLYRIDQVKDLQNQLGLFSDEQPGPTVEPLNLRGVKRLLSKLHDALRDTEGQSNIIDRFDELTKVVFLKVIADRGVSLPRLPRDLALPSSPQEARTLYKKIASSIPSLIPRRFSEIKCGDAGLQSCLEILSFIDFSKEDFDVKGLAYEEVVRNTFDKGDNQQFFTPPNIVDFMVSLCEPFIKGRVCDPACGTGGFLASVARRRISCTSITGLEIDERLAWVTGINLLLHGAKSIQTEVLPCGGTLGRAAEKHFGKYDVILTNPPFGSDLTDRDALDQLALGRGRPSRRRGILFLERCHQLLREGGVIAIVIDEGVLNLPHAGDVRRFILDNYDIQAVVSLPENAFMPYANVNTSILLMVKREGTDNGRRVFFARACNVGRKPNGDEDVQYDRDGRSRVNSDLPSILEGWVLRTSKRQPPKSSDYFCTDLSKARQGGDDCRLDFQFHHPSREASRQLLARAKHRLVPLGDICSERRTIVVPSREQPDSLIRYTGLADIEAFSGMAKQVPTPSNSIKSSVKVYEPGDIVFAKMRPNLRKVALMNFPERGYVSPECAVLAIKKRDDGAHLVDPVLLQALLRSDFVFGQITHLIAGIGRPRIATAELLRINIPLPPVSTQQQIKNNYLQQARRIEARKLRARTILAETSQELVVASDKLVHSFLGYRA